MATRGTPRNLDLALRITADVDQAVQETAALDSGLESIEASGRKAAKGLDTTAQAAERAAAGTDKARTAVELEARALERQNSVRERQSKLINGQRAARVLETQAIDRGTAAIGRQTISVAQYNMAMRQLPMQMTDIVTGLASGQTPFMVLIQQGGQLKDSFGGVVPAARAVLGAINPLAIAAGAGAAAIGMMAMAAYDAGQELDDLENSVALLGGRSGGVALTTSMLVDMAYELDKLDGITMGGAVEALRAVAYEGQFTAEQIELIGTAAVQMERATGRSIDDTVAQFEKIRREPVKALLELNRTQNFLTQSQLDNIQTLVEQGRQADAVAEAFRLYAQMIDDRAPRIAENVSWLTGVWRDLKDVVAETYDGAKNLFRDTPDAQRLVKLQQRIAYLQSMANTEFEGPQDAAEVRRLQGELAALQQRRKTAAAAPATTVDSDKELARLAAEEKWARDEQRYLDRKAKMENEIAEAKKDGLAANKTAAEIAAREAAIRKSYEEKKPKGPKRQSEAEQDQKAAERELENLTKQAALLGQLEDGQKRVSEETRIRYEIEQGSYRLASSVVKQQLLDQAKLLDAKRGEREEQEKQREELKKTETAYERLRDSLRTPAEVALDTAIERVKTLNEALAKGVANSADYQAELSKIVGAGFSKPPDFTGLAPEIGGFDSEQFRLQQSKDALQKWYDEQLAMLSQFRANKVGEEQQWNAQELQIEARHQQALDQLQRAQQQLTMMQAASTFDSLAQMAKAYAGEQSRTYQVLFAISKGFAVAQAAVALAQNVAEASKAGFPQNIGFIAGAFAQGAQIAQLLSAAEYATGGRINGPGTGTSDSVPIWASAGEFMVRERSASQPGAYPFLEDFNRRGMAAVQDWRGYAVRGLITREPIRGGQEPGYQMSDARSMAANVSNRMRLYNLFDVDKLAQMVASHPAMEKKIVTVAAENGQTISAEW